MRVTGSCASAARVVIAAGSIVGQQLAVIGRVRLGVGDLSRQIACFGGLPRRRCPHFELIVVFAICAHRVISFDGRRIRRASVSGGGSA